MRRLTLLLVLSSAASPGEEIAFTRDLKLDSYLPPAAGLKPAAIVVHPGDWTGGSRADASTVDLARWLAGAGYATFAIDHRPEFPAALDDVRSAVRFVRTQARRWNVDSRRLVLVGLESGAHLASLAAVWPGSHHARVSAVMSFFGPSDFRGGWPATAGLARFLAPLIATQGESAALAQASPVMHIDATAPPFLLIHGDADTVISPVQSTHFQNALQAAGVPANLLLIEGGAHGIASWRTAKRDWESEVLAWLAAVLNASPR